jgi:hypothetical protein
MIAKPVLVTPWYSSYRLLEAMLQRNRPMAREAEWWLLYCRYPLLKVQDAMSDTRKAQNLARELGLEWWDGGQEMLPAKALQEWAGQVGGRWAPTQKVILVADEAAPTTAGWIDQLMIHPKPMATLRSKATLYPGVSSIPIATLMGGAINLKDCGFVPHKICEDLGGPVSEGGTYSDSLYDVDHLAWRKVFRKDPTEFLSEYLAARAGM